MGVAAPPQAGHRSRSRLSNLFEFATRSVRMPILYPAGHLLMVPALLSLDVIVDPSQD